jgi:hypothetical protein
LPASTAAADKHESNVVDVAGTTARSDGEEVVNWPDRVWPGKGKTGATATTTTEWPMNNHLGEEEEEDEGREHAATTDGHVKTPAEEEPKVHGGSDNNNPAHPAGKVRFSFIFHLLVKSYNKFLAKICIF